jgi:DNA-binding HxlR family transcriptional regulator
MGKQPAQPRSHCPISFALDVVGDRWTLIVLRDLIIVGKRYFHELLASEEGIASNILTARLKLLEACGMVSRRPDPDNARQVIYEPTAKALDLLPTMVELARWGAMHDAQTAAPRGFVRQVERQRSRVIEEILARQPSTRRR